MDAFLPESIPEVWRRLFFDSNNQPLAELTSGERACYASHLAAMQKAITLDMPILVTEDDVRFNVSPDFLIELIERLPSDWEFIRLSGVLKSRAISARFAAGYKLVEPFRIPNGMVAYLVSPSGADKFIRYSEARYRAIDEDLRRVWEHGAVNYVLDPLVAGENPGFQSDIDKQGNRRNLPERKRKRAATYPGEQYLSRMKWHIQRLCSRMKADV